MSIPKEPRQIMINLMYLVLTAMLALNISTEILHAFKVINDSITKSNAAISDKTGKLYKDFQDNEDQIVNHDRVKPFNDKAKIVKSESQQMIDYLENWKKRMITITGGYEDSTPGQVVYHSESDINTSTDILVEAHGGDTVKQKLLEFRTKILSILSPENKQKLESQIPVKIEDPKKNEDNPKGDWTFGMFHNTPLVAVIALMSKFQNDVRNSEALMIQALYNEAHQTEIKFDEIQAFGVPKTSYVLAGQKVEAEIMMVAFNKSAAITPNVPGGHISKVENGVAHWETVAGGVGEQTVRGNVTIDLGSRKEPKQFEFKYMVGSTGGSMQLDKMNVFYIGVPNPVTVSAAGYSLEDVYLDVPGATITAGTVKGKYNITVSKAGKVMAAIMAKTKDKGNVKVGEMEVRVKSIPDPIAEVGGKSTGAMPSNIFRVQKGVNAALKNFEFDTRFVVTNFTLTIIPRRGEVKGPFAVNGTLFAGNGQLTQAMNMIGPGDKVLIDDIKAKGPDGRNRSLIGIFLSLN